MLLPAVIACKKDPEADGETTDSDTAVTETETEDPLAKYNVSDDIGNRDFGGKVITVATSDYENFIEEINSEGFTGETVNDAIYARNMTVQQRLNVELKQKTVSTGGLDTYHIGQYVKTQMQSGLHEYDLALASTYSNIIRTMDNCWVDLRTLPNIDLSKSYWSQHYNEQISVGDSQYMASGYVSLSFYRKTFVTLMNETMLNSVSGAPDILKDIEDGKWTIEYQKQLAKGYYQDTNGNGKDANDVFGFVAEPYNSVDGYWSSCQMKMIGKDRDNYYEYALDVDRVHGVVDAVLSFYQSEGAWVSSDIKWGDGTVEKFVSKKALMITSTLESVESEKMRGMKDVYLILPIARYTDNQDGYYSYLHDTFLSYAIPNTKITESHLDEVSAVLEVMASESYRTVAPAYYELALKTKYVPDGKTVQLLDSIIANAYVDPGEVYTIVLGSSPLHMFRDIFKSAIDNGTGNTVSSTFSAEAAGKIKNSVNVINMQIKNLKYNG